MKQVEGFFCGGNMLNWEGSLYAIQKKQKWIELIELLHSYGDVFQEPKGLPPQKEYDHKMPIKPGS